jgi:hypothetical protein
VGRGCPVRRRDQGERAERRGEQVAGERTPVAGGGGDDGPAEGIDAGECCADEGRPVDVGPEDEQGHERGGKPGCEPRPALVGEGRPEKGSVEEVGEALCRRVDPAEARDIGEDAEQGGALRLHAAQGHQRGDQPEAGRDRERRDDRYARVAADSVASPVGEVGEPLLVDPPAALPGEGVGMGHPAVRDEPPRDEGEERVGDEDPRHLELEHEHRQRRDQGPGQGVPLLGGIGPQARRRSRRCMTTAQP